MRVSKMTKIAGASLLGFCALSLGADKVNLTPMASQLAGFVGAFLGSLAAQRHRSPPKQEERANQKPTI